MAAFCGHAHPATNSPAPPVFLCQRAAAVQEKGDPWRPARRAARAAVAREAAALKKRNKNNARGEDEDAKTTRRGAVGCRAGEDARPPLSPTAAFSSRTGLLAYIIISHSRVLLCMFSHKAPLTIQNISGASIHRYIYIYTVILLYY